MVGSGGWGPEVVYPELGVGGDGGQDAGRVGGEGGAVGA